MNNKKFKGDYKDFLKSKYNNDVIVNKYLYDRYEILQYIYNKYGVHISTVENTDKILESLFYFDKYEVFKELIELGVINIEANRNMERNISIYNIFAKHYEYGRVNTKVDYFLSCLENNFGIPTIFELKYLFINSFFHYNESVKPLILFINKNLENKYNDSEEYLKPNFYHNFFNDIVSYIKSKNLVKIDFSKNNKNGLLYKDILGDKLSLNNIVELTNLKCINFMECYNDELNDFFNKFHENNDKLNVYDKQQQYFINNRVLPEDIILLEKKYLNSLNKIKNKKSLQKL